MEDNVDNMIKIRDPSGRGYMEVSPFVLKIVSYLTNSKFKPPSMEPRYEESTNIIHRIGMHQSKADIYSTPDEMRYWSFSSTLIGAIHVWYTGLSRGSIENIKQLEKKFIHNFFSGMKPSKCVTHLLNVKQGKNEPLWEYISRLNKEKLEVDDYDESIVMISRISGMQSGKLIWNLFDDPPKTMTKLLATTGRSMNAEEAMEAKRGHKGDS